MRRLALAALVVVVTLLVGEGSVAYAADEIGVSTDGQHWSPALTQPLFDPAVLWVPGDARTATFRVRNQGPSAGTLRVELRTEDPHQLLGNDYVHVETRTTGGSWVELEQAAPRRVATAPVPARAQTQLEVRATFDARSPNQTQDDRAGLALVVRLSGDTPSAADPGPAAVARGRGGLLGSLPRTGADGTAWLLIIAAVSIGFGTALKRVGRQP